MRISTTLSLSLVVVALALLAAACGGSGNVAATVNGVDISVDEVESLISEDSPEDVNIFSQSLATLIQWEITEQAATGELGVEINEDEIDAELESLLTEFGAPSAEQFADAQGITEALLTRYIRQLVIQEAVTASFEETTEDPSDDEVATELSANLKTWTQVCAAHILVASEEEATAVFDRLAADEAFADLAAELSTDPGSGQNGGDLGCGSPEQYVPSFSDATMEAPLQEPFGPVESEFGFHIILVNSRTEASEDEIRTALRSSASLAAVDAWFLEVVDAADVEVPAEYGEWVTEPTPQIIVSG